MKRSDADDIARTLARMFGVPVESDRTAELARYIVNNLSCALCAAEMTTLLYERLERFPTGKHILPVYQEVNTSARHSGHLSITTREHEVGIIETFWRQTASQMCAELIGSDRVGAFVAAEMWNSAVVDATPDAVLNELEQVPTIWLRGRVGEPTDEQVAAMFAAARQAATVPLIELDEATWIARLVDIGAAQDWGKVEVPA